MRWKYKIVPTDLKVRRAMPGKNTFTMDLEFRLWETKNSKNTTEIYEKEIYLSSKLRPDLKYFCNDSPLKNFYRRGREEHREKQQAKKL